MKMIIPGVEWWPQKTGTQQVARVGRICYKSKAKQPDEKLSEEQKEEFREEQAVKMVNRFWESGHRSMLRHGTLYFFVKNDNKLPRSLWSLLVASPYINYAVQEKKVWISTNMQFLAEHPDILNLLESYQVKEDEFIEKALKYECKKALNLLRMTLVVTTQISTSRELNRTSPNCISEQSTRYVNLEKKGGVQIARPHWLHEGTRWQKFLYLTGCKIADWLYRRLLKSGMKPQDARGILPLDTYTVVAYTYTITEWQHILDLRFRETTGKAHPNAREIGFEINRIISERMEKFEAQKKSFK